MRGFGYPIIFLLIGLVLYYPIFNAGFTGDDTLQLVNYPYLHDISAAIGVFYKVIVIQGESQSVFTGYFYRPVTFSIYTVLYYLTSANPIYFHVFQFILFITGVWLLFLFLRSYFSKKISFCLAAVFLIHPANNELGAYIAALGDTLCFVLGMGAFVVLRKTDKPELKSIIFICILLFMALLSKETGVIFVFLILFYASHKKLLRYYGLPILVTAGIYLVCRLNAAQQILFKTLPHPIDYPDFSHRLYLVPQAAYALLREIIIPSRDALRPGAFHAELSYSLFPIVILCFILGVAFGIWRLISRYSKRGSLRYLFFSLWTLVGILPYVQFVPLEVMFADRWLYISGIGVLGMIGAIGSSVSIKKDRWIVAGGVLVILLVLAYALQTLVINFLWLDWEKHFV